MNGCIDALTGFDQLLACQPVAINWAWDSTAQVAASGDWIRNRRDVNVHPVSTKRGFHHNPARSTTDLPGVLSGLATAESPAPLPEEIAPVAAAATRKARLRRQHHFQ